MFLTLTLTITMDDIMILREKHMKTAESRIKDSLQYWFESIERVNEAIQRSKENEIKVKDLTSEVTSMREILQGEKQIVEEKNQELNKVSNCIAQLELEKNAFLEENQSLELRRNKLKTCKSNLQDEELLARGGRRFLLYKHLTGIRWDYEKLKESATGYVCNAKTNYLHHFSYQKGNLDILSNLLWDEVYKSVDHTENKGIHEKENIVQNK